MAVHKIDGVDGTDNFPKKFVTLYGTAAITAANWVMLDITDTTNGLGGSVVTATNTANGEQLAFGVATETTTAAGNIKIQVAGKYENAAVDVTMAAGSSIVVSDAGTGAAGRGQIYVAGDLAPIVGIALEDDTAGVADVMIIDQGYF